MIRRRQPLAARRRRALSERERELKRKRAEEKRERRRQRQERAYGDRGDAVRAMPCLVAGSGGCRGTVQAAHVGAGGMGMKADRRSLVPLCWWHHIEDLHRRGERTFQAAHGVDIRLAAQLVAEELDRKGLA